MFVASVLVVTTPDGVGLRPPDEVAPGEVVFTGVASAALYWRRSRPLAVLAVVIVASATSQWWAGFDIAWIAVVAVYSVGRYVENDFAGHIGAVATAALVVFVERSLGTPWDQIWAGLFATLLVYFVGTRLRLRELRARQAKRDREEDARRVAAEERSRIARDLHDVVAHHVSVMTVQAGAARTVAGDDPAAARAAMEAVERAGREVLSDLRNLLDVLRPDKHPNHLAAEPGLDDIPRLVDQMRAAGTDVEVDMDVDAALPPHVDLFAYRIVQEALTNVLKHAGAGARASVTVAADEHQVAISVVDDGAGGDAQWGAGHGLVGMRERAHLLGGRLDAGPGDPGGFTVAAMLPVGDRRP